MGWLRAHWFGLAAVYLAHVLPYFWVMEGLELVHTHPVAVWLSVLLNAVLAPSLLVLAIHGLPRGYLAPLYIVGHHLLLIVAYLLFLLYWPHFKVLPNFALLHQVGHLPFIFQQLVLQLMGHREWLSIALLGASCLIALRWSRRTAKASPLIAGALGALIIAAFIAKDAVLQRIMDPYIITGPKLMKTLKVRGFIPFLAKQWGAYLHWNLEPTPWPGKINAVQAARESAAAPSALQNILILQVESLDKWIIDHQIDGEYVMPNLRAIKSRSLYFENFFALHNAGGSSDAELAALTGLLPQEFMGLASNNLHFLPSLAKALAGHGYYSAAMHANREDFYRRGEAYSRLGFDRYFGESAYSGDAAGGHAKDLEFIRQSWARIAELPEPFLAYLITIESHAYRGEPGAGAAFASRLGGYIEVMREVDRAIGYLWERLQGAGLLQRSIVLLYADHPSYLREQGCIHQDCVPFLIHAPVLQAGVDGRPGSPIDVSPTLLAMLGIPEPPQAWLGASLLGSHGAEGSYSAEGSYGAEGSTADRKVLFRDGISIHRDPATGNLILRQDEADQKYIQYSDFTFGGFNRPLLPWE